jgi:hypothetical protein
VERRMRGGIGRLLGMEARMVVVWQMSWVSLVGVPG